MTSANGVHVLYCDIQCQTSFFQSRSGTDLKRIVQLGKFVENLCQYLKNNTSNNYLGKKIGIENTLI